MAPASHKAEPAWTAIGVLSKLQNNKAFTLIELLIVIMILGILAALLSGNFFTSLKKGRDAKRKADLDQITKALEMYYEDKRSYPNSITAGNPIEDTVSGKVYMQKVPADPRTNLVYDYEVDVNGGYYKLYACLENTQQVLPYVSNPGSTSCTTQCKDSGGTAIDCIWGISSSNVTP